MSLLQLSRLSKDLNTVIGDPLENAGSIPAVSSILVAVGQPGQCNSDAYVYFNG